MVPIDAMIQRAVDDPDSVNGFNVVDIENMLRAVHPVFQEEPALLELDGSVVFVGDLHGDFPTAKAVLQRFLPCDHVVFLGDYIDREPVRWGSICTLVYLLALKCCFPRKIILLKGNHECQYLIPCWPYEFEEELVERFGSSELHQRFVEVFSMMPLMVRAHRVFAAHGGIVKGADVRVLQHLDKNEVAAVESLVWSDPACSLTYRGRGDHFDAQELHRFLEAVHAKVFVRGHDYTTLGFSIYDDQCLTIFSSQRYKEEGNGGILVAQVDHEVARVQDLCVEDFSSGQWLPYTVKRL